MELFAEKLKKGKADLENDDDDNDNKGKGNRCWHLSDLYCCLLETLHFYVIFDVLHLLIKY